MKKLFYTTLFFIAFMSNTQAQNKKGDNQTTSPSAFTLDQQNHKYYWAASENCDAMEMTIFNKWGELIYNTKDKLQGWDFKQNGQTLAADIYLYTVKIYRNGKWENFTGSIKLDV